MKLSTRKRRLLLTLPVLLISAQVLINTCNDLTALNQAETSLSRSDFPALCNLIKSNHRLSLRQFFDKPGRWNFLRGALAFQQGDKSKAAEYFNQVATGSDFYTKSRITLAEINLDQGHWRSAEKIVFQLTTNNSTIRENQIDSIAALKLLDRYYRMQGRFEDAATVLLEIARISDNPLPPLREYWRTSRGTMPIDLINKSIEICESLKPDESRLWLAKALVAIEKNDFKTAEFGLNRCESIENQPDQPVFQARIKLAMASDTTNGVVESAQKLMESDQLSSGQLLKLADDIANLFALNNAKKSIFDIWNRVEPDHPLFLGRMAEFLTDSSEINLLKTINQRKSFSDQSHETWQKLILGPDEPSTSDQFQHWINAAANAGEMRVAAIMTLHSMRVLPGNKEINDISRHISIKLQSYDDNKAACHEILRKVIQSATEKPLKPALTPSSHDRPSIPSFQNIASESGFQFQYDNGETPIRQMPVALGGGVGLIDFDRDGLLDIFVVQGGSLPHDPAAKKPGDRFFRNIGQLQFRDVTTQLHLPNQSVGYGLGVTVGDVNNDTWPDLFITRFGSYSLYLNQGGKYFTDATAAWGLGGNRDWPTSTAFADFDNDGDLDLYVCHYVVWSADNPRICRHADTLKFMSCNPTTCEARPDHLFRNDGNRFTDVSDSAGVTSSDKEGRGLGVIAADFDADGLTDIFVANDKSANFLFKNRGEMKFEEVAHLAGVAAGADGSYQAGMGVACGDFNGDGRPDLAVTNYYGESTTLYQNSGNMFFIDRTAASGLASASRLLLGFGIAFFDANNDGLLDLVSTNGHTDDFGDVPYRMPSQLLLGRRTGRFFDASYLSGPEIAQPRLGRGLATGDLDNDGRIDLVLLPQNEPAALLANKTATHNHWLSIRLVGQKSNRDGVGAVLKLTTDTRQYHASRFGGGSYQSTIDPRLHFAWPEAEKANELEIRWPSGRVTKINQPPAGRLIEVDEDRGYNHSASQP